MTKDDIIKMAREAELYEDGAFFVCTHSEIERFAQLVAAHEREALESELLKLKEGIAAPSQYIQGRWDLIGEFQDIIRARGNK